jgi:hypothetical protein
MATLQLCDAVWHSQKGHPRSDIFAVAMWVHIISTRHYREIIPDLPTPVRLSFLRLCVHVYFLF